MKFEKVSIELSTSFGTLGGFAYGLSGKWQELVGGKWNVVGGGKVVEIVGSMLS